MVRTASQPVVRALRADDLPAVKRVIDSTGLFPSEMLDDMVAAFLEGTAGEDIWLVVAAPDPVAVAHCAPERMTSGTWNMLLIAVEQGCQGQGLGSILATHVERHLEEKGQRVLLVETSGLPEFERTRAFYLGLNYDLEARIRDYYRDGEDKIVFRKSLLAVSGA